MIISVTSHLNDYEEMYDEASSDVTKYLANPINAYLLVKRLTADLYEIEDVMRQNAYAGKTKENSCFLNITPSDFPT
jgi:hypothetical protein